MHESELEASWEQGLVELVRTALKVEHASMQHCRHEVERLRHAALASALIAIAEHAEGTLGELPSVAVRDGLPDGLRESASELLVLAELRDRIADLLVQDDRAYRATLLQLRQGADAIRSVYTVARAARKAALQEFCTAWLATRSALIEQAESELLWFMQRSAATGRASNVGQDESSGSE
ncbi:MAG: hypothetical protein ABW352_16285 [Polyangiales bacterium]